MAKVSIVSAIGRRKTSVARVYIKPGSGVISVNGRAFEEYFGRQVLRMIVKQPMVVSEKQDKFDFTITVCGGGLSGQAGAVRHGIARALQKMDPEARPPLKSAGLLSRDQRSVERKKYGRHKARKRPQYSKR